MSRELYVIPRYEQWLMDGGVKTVEAIRKVYFLRKRDLKGDRADGSGRFRGSLIGHPCDRKQALSFIGAPSSTERDMRYAYAGTARHYEWQEAGLSAGFITAIETKFRIGKFRGQVDGMLDNGWVFDLKTITDYSFRSTKNFIGVADEPSPEHEDQVQMYMAASGARRASIVYEARNSLKLAEHIIDYDPARANWMIQRMKRIESIVKGNYMLPGAPSLPPMHRGCLPDTTMRKYCDFSEYCLQEAAKGN